MSDMTTIARPYARAAFEYAHAAHRLTEWSVLLSHLSHAVLMPEAHAFIDNPVTTSAQHVELLMVALPKAIQASDLDAIRNFVSLLAENKRLSILPAVFAQFEALRADEEKTLTVAVSAFSPLDEVQAQRLIESLGARLQRKITLDVQVDESLLGGAIIRADDLVIDGSVRGKLNKLGSNLAA